MQKYLIRGYKLYIDKDTDNESIGYFKTKVELDGYLKEKRINAARCEFTETFIPDLNFVPRYSVLLTLNDNSHIDAEFYEESDVKRFINRHKEKIYPGGIELIDRQKVLEQKNQQILAYLVIGIIALFVLYLMFN